MIVATLVGQGLTLPWLIRHLGVLAPTGANGEEVHARLAAVEAALRRLEELKNDYPDHLPLIDQLREEYEHEAGHVMPSPGAGPDEAEQELLDHRAIRNAVLVAEREAVIAPARRRRHQRRDAPRDRARPGPRGPAGRGH